MRTVLLTAALLAIPATASATTLRHVGPKGYGSIQSAIDASAPGDIVQLSPTVWHESLTITKHLTIETLPGSTTDATIVGTITIDGSTNESVTLVDLVLQGTGGTGATIRGTTWSPSHLANISLSHVTVWFGDNAIAGSMNLTMTDSGIVYPSGDGIAITGTVNLDRVSVFGTGGDGIEIVTSWSSAPMARIANTKVTQAGGFGIHLVGSAGRSFGFDHVTIDEATKAGICLDQASNTQLANITITSTQRDDGWGDGIAVIDGTRIVVDTASITANGRAGVAAFGGQIGLRNVALLRNGIALDVEEAGHIDDLGGNRCTSADGGSTTCAALSSHLSPPDPPALAPAP